ncbi:hypothetical protein FA13DRAFT_1735997 [Coprinellus micaceus]|uniref:Cyanovirin-N domain-containing protein n=1 Tax=Coprinellus micaceus TaxID=71717 RepID=A0A4Y7T280_COPMI|nr:hypothetical protein FA13DRAFT_1735997 [Coprinellus micaceus]
MTPHESILLSAARLGLRNSSILHGICQKADGSSVYSEIDLDLHYGNKGGKFSSGGAKFKSTGRRFTLELGESQLMLKGELYSNGDWIEDKIDISPCIVVKDGQFVFEHYDGTLGRDGWLANIAERIPLVGYFIAGLHRRHGNQDQPRRAIAHCTNSTIVTAVVFIAERAMGPLGGFAMAFLSTPLAILVKNGVADGINDPRIRAQFEITVKQALVDSFKNNRWGNYLAIAVWLSKRISGVIEGTLSRTWLALSFIGKSIRSWWTGDDKVPNEWVSMATRESVQTKDRRI